MKKKISMMNIFKNPSYRGKHVILAAGKIFTAKTGEGAAEILKKLEERYPKVTPEVAYLPKAKNLIFSAPFGPFGLFRNIRCALLKST